VGRQGDFDRSFLPARESVGERWKRIDHAFHRCEDLPPVELYKVGDAYFVLDGYHRVSVLGYHGVRTVEAKVTEFRPKLSPPVAETRREVKTCHLISIALVVL
jgi:hypothetical protein